MAITQILLCGDSIAQGDIGQHTTAYGGLGSWAELTAEILANNGRYGPLLGAGIRHMALGEWTAVGAWSQTAVTDLFDKAMFGLAKYANGGTGFTYTWTRPTRWRAVVGFAVYWIDYTGGGNWQYRVDGGTWTNMGQTVAQDNGLKKFYVPTAVTSTVDFRAYDGASNAGVCLAYIEPFFTDPRAATSGLIVQNIGVAGNLICFFTGAGTPSIGSATSVGDHLAFFDSVTLGTGSPITNRPNFVLAGTFSNDVGVTTTAEYQSHQHVVQQRATGVGAPFVWINCYEQDPLAQTQANQNAFRAAAVAQAASDGTPVLDLYVEWAAQYPATSSVFASTTAAGLLDDQRHPSQIGHLDIPRRLVPFLRRTILGTPTLHRSKPFVVGKSQLGGTDVITGALELDPSVRHHVRRPRPPGRRAPSGVGFAPRVSHAGDRQVVTPAGIASTNAFGVLSTRQTFHPTGIASTAAVIFPFATTIPGTFFLALTGIAPTSALGAPTVAPTTHLLVTGIVPTEHIAIPSATTIRDVKTLAATGLASTVTFGAPALSAGSQANLLPTGIPTVATVALIRATSVTPPIVIDRVLRPRPPGRHAPNGIGFRRFLPGNSVAAQVLQVVGIPPSGTYTTQGGIPYTTQAASPYTGQHFPTVGTPKLTKVLTALPTGIGSSNQFGVPNVAAKRRIVCTGIPSTVAFGAPTFVRFQAPIHPVGIASTNRFGRPGSRATVGIVGIASTVQFGLVSVKHAAHWNVEEPEARWEVGFPHGRWHAWDPDDEEDGVVYTHVAPPVGPPTLTLTFAGIVSTVALGFPSFPAPDQSVSVAAIAPTSVLGAPALALGTAGTARPHSITSTVALGSPRARAGGAFTGPAGIASTLALGQPTVARPALRSLHPIGLASTVVLGISAAKRPAKKILSPAGRASTIAIGAPVVKNATIGPPPPPLTLQQQIDATPTNGTLDIGSQKFVVPVTFGFTKPMRLTGNPDAYIKLQTTNPTDAAKRNMPTIDIRADNFTIDGFQIIGDGPSNASFVITKEARHAIQVTGTNNTTIRNMYLHNTYGDGIAAIKHISSTGVQEDCVNLAIEDCILDQIGRVGITLDNVKGGHCTGSAPDKMVIRRHNNSGFDIEPPGGNDGCTDFVISNVDVYFNPGAGFTVSSAGTGGPEWIPGQPNPDPATYTIRNIHLDQIRSHGAAFTITITPPAFKAAYTDAKGVHHKQVNMVRRGPFFVTSCSGDTPFNSASEPYRFHHCDGVTIVNSNQTLGQNATAMAQFDDCTNATITPPATISP